MIPAPSGSNAPSPIIHNVLHPSDLSDASRVAFAHALKAALLAKGKLTLLHETEDEGRDWSEFPGVRSTLERWGVLPDGSAPEALDELGIEVAKIIGSGSDPVRGVLGYLEENGADLIVLATHHHGFDWLHKSVAEPVARMSREMTLFVPADGRGFISPEDGTVSLRNVLIPVAEEPPARPAILGAARIVQQLRVVAGSFTMLHVGENEPDSEVPSVPGWSWNTLLKKGNPVDAILESARETDADLIIMSTDGRNGFLDALRGSHSERVLRQATCPLLAIPKASHAAAAIRFEEKSSDWYRQREKPPRRASRPM
jgi:nucleotide-binding universal stress UspA family protein